jgi:hypothetical protein
VRSLFRSSGRIAANTEPTKATWTIKPASRKGETEHCLKGHVFGKFELSGAKGPSFR